MAERSPGTEGGDPLDALAADSGRLCEALGRLGERDREALMLVAREGLASDDAARERQIWTSTSRRSRALPYVRGIELVGPVRDRLGRRGTAVARVEGDTRRELVFDPETSVMLAERDVVLRPRPGREARSCHRRHRLHARGVVDSPRERPPAR